MKRFRNAGASTWVSLIAVAVAGIGALGVVLTLSAAGSGNVARGVVDFTPHGTQPGLLSAMEPPTGCFSCHREFNSESSASDFMPHNTWGGSMMAHAARDPLFWAALDVANADVPGVGDYCLRCHTPTGWLEGRVAKTPGGGRIEGEDGCALTGNHTSFEGKGNDYAGLTCHFCHRMTETGPEGEVGPHGNGNFWIDDALNCETPEGVYGGPCRHGPYDYAPGDDRVAPHGWVYSSFLDKGPVCGTCHDVSTPTTSAGPLKTLILPDGSDSGIPMPIERTFTEWQQSDYADVIFRNRMGDDFAFAPQLGRGASCQDCHMANSEDPTARACGMHEDGARAGDLPVHEFVGANTWVPAIIRGEYGPALSAIDNRVDDLTRTIARARHMLTERSARIETAVSPPVAGSGALQVAVKVTNLAGHKLPTGYAEGRRMWLHVEAYAGTQTVPFWQSGAWDPSTGELEIDSQTRVYETKQGIWNAQTQTCDTADSQGRAQFHFVLNNCIAKDNRIPPLGFTGGDSLETRPVGLTYPETTPGSGRLVNFDVANYTVPVPAGVEGEVTIKATLRFQIASDDYINFLKNQAVERNFEPENTMCSTGPDRPFTVGPQDKTRGQFIHDLWNDPEYGRSPPEDMVSHSATVTVVP
jgi:hypothetical protein